MVRLLFLFLMNKAALSVPVYGLAVPFANVSHDFHHVGVVEADVG